MIGHTDSSNDQFYGGQNPYNTKINVDNPTSALDRALTRDRYWYGSSAMDIARVMPVVVQRPEIFPAGLGAHLADRLILLQNPDGSWGDATRHYNAAILDTAHTIESLLSTGFTKLDLKKSVAALDRLISRSAGLKMFMTAGYELVLPGLFDTIAQAIGGKDLFFSQTTIDEVERIRKLGSAKDAAIRKYGILGQQSTASFSLEYALFRDLTDLEKGNLATVKIDPRNGMMLSPAASVAAVKLIIDNNLPDQALKGLIGYLNHTWNATETFHNAYPFQYTTWLWTIRAWMIVGEGDALMQGPYNPQQLLAMYKAFEKPELGIGFGPGAPLDLDDSAMLILLSAILKANQSKFTPEQLQGVKWVGAEILEQFIEGNHVICYKGEAEGSLSHLLNALIALEYAAKFSPNDVSPLHQKLIELLVNQLNPAEKSIDQLLNDKWHTGYYAASLWMLSESVRNLYPQVLLRLVDYFLQVQDKSTGGFGTPLVDGTLATTAEETSYISSAMINLLKDEAFLDRAGQFTDREALVSHIINSMAGARSYLAHWLQQGLQEPALWTCKTTFVPIDIISAALIKAIYDIEGLFTELGSSEI